MVLTHDDAFIADIMTSSTIDNVRLIEYNGMDCMVKILDKNSFIKKFNPQYKYIIRFPKSNDKGMISIEYIAITSLEYKNGLKKRREYMKSLPNNKKK